jgi:hypothetical protein
VTKRVWLSLVWLLACGESNPSISSDGLGQQPDAHPIDTHDAASGDAAAAPSDASSDAALASEDAAQAPAPDAASPVADAGIGAVGNVPDSCEAIASDDACTSCLKTQCCATLNACTGECAALLNCANDCGGGSSCSSSCLGQHPAGSPGLFSIYNCQTSKCATPCANQAK